MPEALRSTIDKWEVTEQKRFCKAKDIVIRIKWQPTNCKKDFTNPTSNKGLISKFIKNSRGLTATTQITQLKMGYRAKQRILTEES